MSKVATKNTGLKSWMYSIKMPEQRSTVVIVNFQSIQYIVFTVDLQQLFA